MLRIAALFPHPGSFALFVDTMLPVAQQRAELVRIQRRYEHKALGSVFDMAAVSFPLRQGASGSKAVLADDLIDGTPLNAEERKEHAILENHLRGRERLTPRLKEMLKAAEKLRQRAIFSMVLESELAKLRALEAKAAPSIGGHLPNEVAA